MIKAVALYASPGTPVQGPNTIKEKKWQKEPLPQLSPWINILCCWEHQAPRKELSTGICNEMFHWDGWVTSHPLVRENYSATTGILSFYKLNLMKCTKPGVEHSLLKEGREWRSWFGISHAQPNSSHLTVLPPTIMYGMYDLVKFVILQPH